MARKHARLERGATTSHLRFGNPTEDLEDSREQDAAPSQLKPTKPEEPPWRDLQEKASGYNMEGMEFMRRGENEDAFRCFEKAQECMASAEQCCPPEEMSLLTSTQAAMASSLAICHKREGHQGLAVRNFKKALELYEAGGADLRTLVAAHLNLAACFMEVELPGDALKHSEMAVELCGQLIAAPELATSMSSAGEAERRTVLASGLVSLVRPDDYAMLVVAYHKSAEAHEALRQWGQATLAYTQAYEVVRRSLGPDHHLTKSFEKSARCPRKPNQPEVPLSWRLNPAGQKRMPQLPHVPKLHKSHDNTGSAWQVQGAELRSAMPGEPAYSARGHISYKMDDSMFPTWPPPDLSTEEKQWYSMAKQDRDQKRSQVLADIKGGSVIENATRALLQGSGLSATVRSRATSVQSSRPASVHAMRSTMYT